MVTIADFEAAIHIGPRVRVMREAMDLSVRGDHRVTVGRVSLGSCGKPVVTMK